jgi:quercetin dioxygenase-like cupin family protein
MTALQEAQVITFQADACFSACEAEALRCFDTDPEPRSSILSTLGSSFLSLNWIETGDTVEGCMASCQLWSQPSVRLVKRRERDMDIKPAASNPTRRGNPDYFTGTVHIDTIIEAPAPARVRAARVSFEPGARTAWHTHPLGQTLYVLHGVGRIQTWGGPIREIRAGDTIWIPPEEKHWHGAAPASGMVHLAMQEALDGVQVQWLEKVTDEIYEGVPAP